MYTKNDMPNTQPKITTTTTIGQLNFGSHFEN